PFLRAVDPVREPQGAQGILAMQLFKASPRAMPLLAACAEHAFEACDGPGLLQAGLLVSLEAENNFPQHPVRTDGPWLVWLAVVRDEAALAEVLPVLEDIAAQMRARDLIVDQETAVLDPGLRSRLRWTAAGEVQP
ncbi:MAG TPA: hypothetical protein VIT92_14255, partial [Burkholderiaceae bacterium]